MQERHVLAASPIAAVERVRANQVERAGDRSSIPLGEDQQHLVRHLLPEQREERTRQIGPAPFARAGILIERPEGVPIRLAKIRAGDASNAQPVQRGGAFLADRLALARCERVQKSVEARIAPIAPVELHALPNQPAGLFEQRDLFRRDEGRMRRRQAMLIGHRLQRGDQRWARCGIAQQQPRPRHRAERRSDLELGIISPASALPGIGPGVVENIFALAVALRIGRGDRCRGAIRAINDHRHGLPARLRHGASRSLENRQKGVADERIGRARASIPFGCGHGRYAGRYPCRDRCSAHWPRRSIVTIGRSGPWPPCRRASPARAGSGTRQSR